MKWTDAHDVMLCREILLMRPYSFKPGTKESGSAWFSVASDLNTVQELKFTVNQKSVRDRTKLLLEHYNTRMREQENASGSNDNPSEIDQLMCDIKSEWKESSEQWANMTASKVKEVEKSKEDAESIRTVALENLSETKKRKADDEQSPTGGKSKRNTGSGTMSYLMAKLDSDTKWREQELEIKKRAVNRELLAQDNFAKLLEQQRQININQQEQNKLMVQLMSAMVNKNNLENQKKD